MKLLKGHIKDFTPEQLEGLPEIIPISGGKDSTALALIMREKYPNKKFKFFCCISGELEIQQEYLHKIEKELGSKIYRLKSKKPFEYYLLEHPRTSGKLKGVKGYGWPHMRNFWCNRILKEEPVNEWMDKKFPGVSRIVHIGIGADEVKRTSYHSSQPMITSHPLVDMGLTTMDCRRYLEKRNLLNPAYKYFARFSCYFCPLKSIDDYFALYKHFRKYWEHILWMDREALKRFDRPFKPNCPAEKLDKLFKRSLF